MTSTGQSTNFKTVKTCDKDHADSNFLTEPIIASFPNNMPSGQHLQKLTFAAFQQEKDNQGKQQNRLKRRLIKAEYKQGSQAAGGVRYQGKNHGHDINPKDQASDYYMGVFVPEENRVFMVPVSTCYQFNQEIQKFTEIYNGEEDNEALKSMNYMNQKLQLANAFGTNQSRKKITSMLTNMVEDGGINQKNDKGVRDHRLADKALLISKDQDVLKSELLSASKRRSDLYSRDQLLPAEVLEQVAYKNTYNALQNDNEEALKQLILSPLAGHLVRKVYSRFEQIATKSEKKLLLKACIYLDSLITFYRLPQNLDQSLEVYSSKANIPLPLFEKLVEKFSTVSFKNQSMLMNHESVDSSLNNSSVANQYKYTKSKEQTKMLICHVIGINAILNQGGKFKASHIARVLKKEVTDLKSYFQELGLDYSVIKEDGKDDILVSTVVNDKPEYQSGGKQSFHKDRKDSGAGSTKSGKSSASKKSETTNTSNDQIGVKRTKRQQKHDQELARLAAQVPDQQ
eukprot:403336035